jgi:Na+-transporting NADH:ubiquinone oxidoreductase subunit NqrD
MWTAAKLVAGLLLGALCWYVSELVKPLLPEGFDPRRMSEINAIVGFLVGWTFLGTRVRDSMTAAISYGFTGSLLAAVWCLAVDSTLEMLRLSMRGQYDGPVEAIMDIFEMMLEYGQLMVTPAVLVPLLGGGVIVGIIAEITSRRAN